ncbi:nicotinamide-nucleotide amidase [Oikeobacillus pervagus]|uniref:Putative competence-damage inducible protein n=1 Tax=Oikeobacillus pervagus TaxID=1325931 RepID=A0AAJ1WI24_9BACI|nr:competence/damage-inducible protein A [Oikeobacillus pervagus]MDQ0214215.1 nicotinamide-nucleotide amidase [Oikeobacillus pervagus]
MNAEIIAVGTELLLGQIVNSNAQFLSNHLAEIGVDVFRHTAVGDNADRLLQVIKEAEKRADLLIFTGGLGPTKDDLTKETIANHVKKQLIYDEEALESIQIFFEKTKLKMTENNKKQALVMEDSTVLPNRNGMAPGMFLKTETNSYMLLPGPPKEMQPMFLSFGKPLLMQLIGQVEKIESKVLRFFGIGESQLETDLEDLILLQNNPTIAPLAGDGEVTIRITAKNSPNAKAEDLIQRVEEKIMERVGSYFYGYDQSSIMEEMVKLLKEQKKTIACAESLTGGLFQSELTSFSGTSEIFKGGIVCYSNKVKEQILGVANETLHTFGAVSEQCAKELAENVMTQFGTDYGISFTGVAGPDSLEGKKPGTVWIGLAEKGSETKAFLLQLVGSRNGIRKRTVKYGCHYVLQLL